MEKDAIPDGVRSLNRTRAYTGWGGGVGQLSVVWGTKKILKEVRETKLVALTLLCKTLVDLRRPGSG